MQRIEVQKKVFRGILAAFDEPNAYSDLVDSLNLSSQSTLLEMEGIGIIAEYASKKCASTLMGGDRLAVAFRKDLVPDSTVSCIKLDPARLKVTGPVYDIVIINDITQYNIAKMLAKIAIVNANTGKVEYLNTVTEEYIEESVINTDAESENVAENNEESVLPNEKSVEPAEAADGEEPESIDDEPKPESEDAGNKKASRKRKGNG